MERPDLEGLKDQAVKHQEFELACGIRYALYLELKVKEAADKGLEITNLKMKVARLEGALDNVIYNLGDLVERVTQTRNRGE